MSIWRTCEDVVRPYSRMDAAAQDARMRPVDKMLHGSERLSLRSLEFVPTGSASRLRAASQDGGETLAKPEQPSLFCIAWDFWLNIAMGRPRTHRADANRRVCAEGLAAVAGEIKSWSAAKEGCNEEATIEGHGVAGFTLALTLTALAGTTLSSRVSRPRLVPPFPRNSNRKVGLADLYPAFSPASIVAHTRLFQGRAAVSLTSMERGPIYWLSSSTPHHRSVESLLAGSPFATEDVISHCAGQRSNRDAGDPWQLLGPHKA